MLLLFGCRQTADLSRLCWRHTSGTLIDNRKSKIYNPQHASRDRNLSLDSGRIHARRPALHLRAPYGMSHALRMV